MAVRAVAHIVEGNVLEWVITEAGQSRALEVSHRTGFTGNAHQISALVARAAEHHVIAHQGEGVAGALHKTESSTRLRDRKSVV